MWKDWHQARLIRMHINSAIIQSYDRWNMDTALHQPPKNIHWTTINLLRSHWSNPNYMGTHQWSMWAAGWAERIIMRSCSGCSYCGARTGTIMYASLGMGAQPLWPQYEALMAVAGLTPFEHWSLESCLVHERRNTLNAARKHASLGFCDKFSGTA